ncbi:MAG: 50S ribosomal protein L35 [Candidatus Falkowbacteria bacterium]
MPKMKTIKTVSKRFKITKSGKIMKKTCGQDHFNARESGNVTRSKRRMFEQSGAMTKALNVGMPYKK